MPLDGYFGKILDTGIAGCPTFWAFFGKVSPNTTESITTISCSGYMQQVQANASFTLPGYQINTAALPAVDETTAAFFSNQSKSFLSGEFQRLVGEDSENFDAFFQSMVYGLDGVPAEEMAGNSTRLVEAMQHLYRVYTAQRFNLRMRIPSDGKVFTGTFVYPYCRRLHADKHHLDADSLGSVGIDVCLRGGRICTNGCADGTDEKAIEHRGSGKSSCGVGIALGVEEALVYVPAPGTELWGSRESKLNGLYDGCSFRIR